MKLASYTTLSAAAAVLLQLGTFVHANPMFEEHNDAASTEDNCQGFRVTFPAGTGLQFEENSKHLVAWGKAPAGLDQVNVTLANANQEAVAWLGLYDASLGATTSEMPFPLNGQQPGDYHIHLAGVGSNACQVDSDPFKMNAAKTIQQATTNNLQQTGSNTSNDDHEDAASNFTNDDQRTHLNEDMLNEIEQLAQEKTKHDNAKYFTNDDQRTNKQHSNADASWFTNDDQRSHKNDSEHDDSLDAWSTEEVSMEDAKTWHDDSADVVDHSNVGEWTSEDLDRAHVDAEGFYNEEEHENDATVNYITDYSNVGEWQAEQVDANEDEYVASHDDASPADGWVEDGKSDLFDHTNLGSFSAEEITVDDDVQQHQDITGWQAEEIQVMAEEQQQHDNVADQWVDESGNEQQEQHEDDATAWITEELDENGLSNDIQQEHKNDVEEDDAPAEWHMDELPTSVPSWEEQVDNASLADHTDAAPFIAEEIKEENEHANIADQWMDESSSSSSSQPHANVADQWMDESSSSSAAAQPHANVADQWIENDAAPHTDQAAPTGKATTGILPNYSSDSSALNGDDATTSSSSSNTHNDAAPISWLSPEALMAKW
ncbi:hypothetical protein O0I10_004902 [Lichtheimia ornata]|uniref:Uncharacterized protein n=1 Tax=Lichtheimia ornata TaxID=688661 RepID=A0AAD7V7X2_9FUNG|nr:uncharacterized protein O0I10_004902 [Lichtheimia ornata]KAJ8659537.1 hypothetical protein O0I10_004902 [Lichtheimia ornata]